MTTHPTGSKVLVTGAAGFVGSHLVDALLRQDWNVVGVDNLTTGRLENLANAQLHDAFTLIEGDIRDAEAVREASEDCAIVFHLAAVTKVTESVRKPQKYQEINVTGTQHVLDGAVQAKVRRVVFASSAAVYGAPETVPIPEEAATQPLSPYGLSKLEGERLCQTMANNHELQVPQLRLFNIFGPRQLPENEAGVVSTFIDRAQHGLPLVIFGDGHQTRDFIFIDDVVEAFIRAATHDSVPSTPINVGTGTPVSIIELAEAVQHQFPACNKEIHYKPPRAGDIYHSVGQISRMQQLLQFTPQYSLYTGLRQYCQEDPEQCE